MSLNQVVTWDLSPKVNPEEAKLQVVLVELYTTIKLKILTTTQICIHPCQHYAHHRLLQQLQHSAALLLHMVPCTTSHPPYLWQPWGKSATHSKWLWLVNSSTGDSSRLKWTNWGSKWSIRSGRWNRPAHRESAPMKRPDRRSKESARSTALDRVELETSKRN